MKFPKKRTLNELRQTKDSYYKVPHSEKEMTLEKIIKDYLIFTKDSINLKNIDFFIKHIDSIGYRLKNIKQ